MASFSFSPCLMRKTVEKSEAILALLDSFQCISNGKPEQLLCLMFVFFFFFNEVERSLCGYLVYARL